MAEEHDATRETRNGDRYRRPSPARTEPIRSTAGFVQANRSFSGPTDAQAPDRPHSTSSSDTGGVDYGVDLGYQVIDEYLKQAQQRANDFSPGSPNLLAGWRSTLPPDIEKLADQSMTYYRQFIGAWLRMLTSMGQQFMPPAGGTPPEPGLWGMGAGATPQSGPGRHPTATNETVEPSLRAGPWQDESPDTQPATTTIGVSLRASRPAIVSFDLKRHTQPLQTIIHPLRSLDAKNPVIDGVCFITKDNRISLQVIVPDDLPPGIYAGAIVAKSNGSACGTVSVEVQ